MGLQKDYHNSGINWLIRLRAVDMYAPPYHAIDPSYQPSKLQTISPFDLWGRSPIISSCIKPRGSWPAFDLWKKLSIGLKIYWRTIDSGKSVHLLARHEKSTSEVLEISQRGKNYLDQVHWPLTLGGSRPKSNYVHRTPSGAPLYQAFEWKSTQGFFRFRVGLGLYK